MNFNENLMRLRKQKGLSQEELGNLLNVARQTVSKWELGTTTPELDKLIQLSRLFEISVDELIGNDFAINRYANPMEEEQPNSTPPGPVNFRELMYLNTRGFHYEYKSSRTIMGIPLVHINVGFMRKAKGIIAIGNIAQGVIAFGGLAFGIVAFGGLAAGLLTVAGVGIGLLLALGGVALGGIAIGGLAVGVFAMGGCAIGVYSMGGAAIASKIASGGYASGHIAIGDKVKGTVCFLQENGDRNLRAAEIKNAIQAEFPGTWRIVVKLFSVF